MAHQNCTYCTESVVNGTSELYLLYGVQRWIQKIRNGGGGAP